MSDVDLLIQYRTIVILWGWSQRNNSKAIQVLN